MPKFIVIDFLNHEGEIKPAGAEVELPVQVAAHPNVRGHIKPAPGDEAAEVALLPERDGTLSRNELRAGAPLREHELVQRREYVMAERRLYETRMLGVDADLKTIDDELARLRAPASPAAPAPAGPSVGTAVAAAPAPPVMPSPAPATAVGPGVAVAQAGAAPDAGASGTGTVVAGPGGVVREVESQ